MEEACNKAVDSPLDNPAGNTCHSKKVHRLMGRVSGTQVEQAPCNKLQKRNAVNTPQHNPIT